MPFNHSRASKRHQNRPTWRKTYRLTYIAILKILLDAVRQNFCKFLSPFRRVFNFEKSFKNEWNDGMPQTTWLEFFHPIGRRNDLRRKLQTTTQNPPLMALSHHYLHESPVLTHWRIGKKWFIHRYILIADFIEINKKSSHFRPALYQGCTGNSSYCFLHVGSWVTRVEGGVWAPPTWVQVTGCMSNKQNNSNSKNNNNINNYTNKNNNRI